LKQKKKKKKKPKLNKTLDSETPPPQFNLRGSFYNGSKVNFFQKDGRRMTLERIEEVEGSVKNDRNMKRTT
jgi:hypothetical protein